MADNDTQLGNAGQNEGEGDLVIPTMDEDGNMYVAGERLYTLPEAGRLFNLTINTIEYYLRTPQAPLIYQGLRGYRYITLSEMERFVKRVTGLRPVPPPAPAKDEK